MPDCTRCRAPADGFACRDCVRRLTRLLDELPWWLDELEFTATGQARVADVSGRRIKRYRQPIDGDAHPLAAFPADDYPSLAHAHHDREQAVLRDALARGKVNARASELAGKVRACLLEWVRDLCETRGVEMPVTEEAK